MYFELYILDLANYSVNWRWVVSGRMTALEFAVIGAWTNLRDGGIFLGTLGCHGFRVVRGSMAALYPKNKPVMTSQEASSKYNNVLLPADLKIYICNQHPVVKVISGRSRRLLFNMLIVFWHTCTSANLHTMYYISYELQHPDLDCTLHSTVLMYMSSRTIGRFRSVYCIHTA